jgi:predicted RNA binding protein YcfA (HicA-like mRNA interferase family)
MARREKLLRKMRLSPQSIRFGEIEALLRYEGFVSINQRGSHHTFQHSDGRVIMVVRPHGGRKTCHPNDVYAVLDVLGVS